MSKTSIVNHFSEQGVINCMGKEAHIALFMPYAAYFLRRGLDLNFAQGNKECEEQLEQIKVLLMNINLEDKLGSELSELLDDIDTLNRHYDLVSKDVEDVLQNWRSDIEKVGLSLNERLPLVVSLCLCENIKVKEALSLIVSRVACMTGSTNRDYNWYGVYVSDEQEKKPKFVAPDVEKLKEKVKSLQKEIDKGFKEHNFSTKCRVNLYPKGDDGEIWALVEHGSRYVVKETMSEEGESGTVKYPPLARSIVVLDCSREILRLKTGAEWMYELLQEKFSFFFCGLRDAFIPGSMYRFTPIYDKGVRMAFSTDVFKKTIRTVHVTNMRLRICLPNKHSSDIILTGGKGIEDSWEFHQQFAQHEIKALSLVLRIAGCSSDVYVRIDGEKGLTVSKARYTGLVRSWLRRLGFETHYTPKQYECGVPTEESALLFWPTVADIIRRGPMNKSVLYLLGEKSPGVADYLAPYLYRQEGDEGYSKLWTDENGKTWGVYKDTRNDRYYTDGNEIILGHAEAREIDADEVELLRFDVAKMASDLHSIILPGSANKVSPKNNGMYHLGKCVKLGVDLFLHLPQQESEDNWNGALGNKAPKGGEKAILACIEKPLSAYTEQVAGDVLQYAWLHELLRWDAKDKKIVVETPVSDYLQQSEVLLTQQEAQAYTRWPLAFPEGEPSFLHIDLTIGEDYMHVKYGESQRTFRLSQLPMFVNQKAGQSPANAQLEMLRELIEAHNKDPYNGFKFTDIGTKSTRTGLQNALRDFFAIQGSLFMPAPSGKKGYHVLAFAKCACDNSRYTELQE